MHQSILEAQLTKTAESQLQSFSFSGSGVGPGISISKKVPGNAHVGETLIFACSVSRVEIANRDKYRRRSDETKYTKKKASCYNVH